MHMTNTRTIVASVLGFLVVATASPAFAQTPPNVPLGANTSENWSGYVATGSTYTDVQGSWVVAASSVSNSSSADATWVGIGGVRSNDLIQAGTQALVQNGSVAYESWYELLPNYQVQIPVTIRSGDTVSVSINETSANVWQISFTDTTTGSAYSTSVDYDSSLSSAEWIEEMPIGESGNSVNYLPLDAFGSVAFSNGYTIANGVNESIAASGALPLTMATESSVVLASPSALGADGASFSVVRSNAVVNVLQPGTGFGWRRNGNGMQGYVGYSVSYHGRYMRQRNVTIGSAQGGGMRFEYIRL